MSKHYQNTSISSFSSSKKLRLCLAGIYNNLLYEFGYVNKDKLTAVFEMWLKYYVIARASYNVVIENELNIFTLVSRLDNIHFSNRNESPRPTYVILKNILSIIPLKYFVFPGGKMRVLDTIIAMISVYKTRRFRVSLNKQLFSEFQKRCRPVLTAGEFKLLIRAVPSELFSRQTPPQNNPTTIQCSPTCFFNTNYLRALFIEKPILIKGIQHGGNYGEFTTNHFEQFEQQISDKFYYWGLGGKNIRQNRFHTIKAYDRKIKRIAKVETVVPNSFIRELIPANRNGNSQPNINIDQIIEQLGIKNIYSIVIHPKFKKDGGENYKPGTPSMKLLEDYLPAELESTLFIIDRPGHTFFYQAVYQALPFILFINRDWVSSFTPKYKKLIKLLSTLNVLNFWDETDKFITNMNKFTNDYSYPKDVFIRIRDCLESNLR